LNPLSEHRTSPEVGWVEEAMGILNEGLRKFPGDEDIENLLEKIEDETDDPEKG
jgi:hypothetical protein